MLLLKAVIKFNFSPTIDNLILLSSIVFSKSIKLKIPFSILSLPIYKILILVFFWKLIFEIQSLSISDGRTKWNCFPLERTDEQAIILTFLKEFLYIWKIEINYNF
jgi:hypothetical protein